MSVRLFYFDDISSDDFPRYTGFRPAEFREGDVVEAAISFVAYPLPRDGEQIRFKLVYTLRALSMVSSEFREVCYAFLHSLDTL